MPANRRNLPCAPPETVDKCEQLRVLLNSANTEFIMEAHNGISARIVQEAGFKGIWASGLALSAQYGVRDSNEASWTQVVEMLEFMSDVTAIPILLDGDTGYGNFNNMRRLVKKLEQRDIAGVCIEDKQFPKTNSFIGGERQSLADVSEFCGKIKAGKDSQRNDNFSVVARVEALIAGWGMDEALRRAEAYHAAGADAILIHSKLSRPDQILTFAKEWAGRAPLIIVPTKYYSTPTAVFRKAGISLVIWANHMIRAAVAGMQTIARQIQQAESLTDVEDRIAAVDEIFRLQGADELARAEKRYFASARPRTAIVLAASRGHSLAELTRDRPKVMISVGGQPLLQHMVTAFKKCAIDDITVVAGYKAEAINVRDIGISLNEAFGNTGELTSLACARENFSDDMLVTYGDLLFRGYVLEDLLGMDAPISIVVDSLAVGARGGGSHDIAYCSVPDERSLFDQDVELVRICDEEPCELDLPCGRWIGMLRIRGEGRHWLEQAMAELGARADFTRLNVPDLLNHLVDSEKPVKVLYISGHWLDVNTLEDLDRAGSFTHGTGHGS